MALIDNYEDYDALGLAALVATKQATPLDLLESAVARIEERNPVINAVVSTFYDRARQQIALGLPRGPFTGVPFLLKDLGADYQGTPLQAGSRLLAGNISAASSTLVQRYLAAGVVILGKASTSEFGLIGTVETAAHGTTRNPWDTSRSTGGSSGGSAAAVAARMVPAAHGGDGGGSIRIPSAWCGLFGLKPSRGRNPSGPAGEGWAGLSCGHVITRSVRDSAAFLDATHGPELGDPYAAPPPERPYLQEVGAPVERLRIGVVEMPPPTIPSADALAALQRGARLCEELGHDVELVALPFSPDKARDQLRLITAAHVAYSLQNRARQSLGRDLQPGDVERQTWEAVEAGRRVSGPAYAEAIAAMHAFGRKIAPYFAQYDVILSPTVAQPPQPLGSMLRPENDLDSTHKILRESLPFTQLYNQTGQPAASLPLYWTAEGLPMGVQIAAAYGRDGLLLRLAAQLEAAVPWGARKPPLLAPKV